MQAGSEYVAGFAGIFERLAVDRHNCANLVQHTGSSYFGQSVIGDDLVVVKIFRQREIEVLDFVFLASHDFDEAAATVLIQRFFRHQAGRARREIRRRAIQRFETLRQARRTLRVRRGHPGQHQH